MDDIEKSDSNDQFLLCVKSGKKWTSVAGVTIGPESCIARAAHVFADAGYAVLDNKVCWGEVMTKQSNYIGKSLNYKRLQAPVRKD
jgi:hypothetical protein